MLPLPVSLKCINCVDDVALLFLGHTVVHGQRKHLGRILLGDGEIPLLMAQILIGFGQMGRNRIVNNRSDLLFLQIFFQLVALLASLPVPVACAAVLCGDPFCKFVASMTINFLPYARPAAQSKSGVVYAPMRVGEIVCGAAFGVLPMLSLFYPPYWLAGLAPFACIAWLIRQMRRRIGGYTGDCCGAAFLLCEGSFYVALVVLYRYYGSGAGAAYLG